MKSKVIHLIGHLKMGGAETLITDYALKINKNKFTIVIVTLDGKNNTFNEEILEKNGIKVIYLGDLVANKNSKNIFIKVVTKVQRYLLFRRLIKQERPDILHAHLNVTGYVYLLDVKNIKKIFYTFHSEVNKMYGKGKLRYKFFTKFCIKQKGMIPIALHSRMKQEVNELFKTDKCIVVHNAIDVNKFRSLQLDKYNIKKSLNIEPDAFLIGHVGRFTEAKNHRFIIEVFVNVQKINPNAHLLLIGTGHLEKEIENIVRDLGLNSHVTFLGNRSDIPNLMKTMDVFFFPSLYEGFGNVLLEAQAAGTRCIISKTIPKETIVSGLVTAIGLEESIDKWSKLILEPPFNEKNHRNNIEDYDINRIVKKLESIYSQ